MRATGHFEDECSYNTIIYDRYHTLEVIVIKVIVKSRKG